MKPRLGRNCRKFLFAVPPPLAAGAVLAGGTHTKYFKYRYRTDAEHSTEAQPNEVRPICGCCAHTLQQNRARDWPRSIAHQTARRRLGVRAASCGS